MASRPQYSGINFVDLQKLEFRNGDILNSCSVPSRLSSSTLAICRPRRLQSCLQVFLFAKFVCKFFGFGKLHFLQDYDRDNSTSLYFTQTEVKMPDCGSKIIQFPRQVLERVPPSLLYLGAIYGALFVIGRLVCYLSDISIS